MEIENKNNVNKKFHNYESKKKVNFLPPSPLKYDRKPTKNENF